MVQHAVKLESVVSSIRMHVSPSDLFNVVQDVSTEAHHYLIIRECTQKDCSTVGQARMYVTPNRIFWVIFTLNLGLSYTDKLLVCRWVQIVVLL